MSISTFDELKATVADFLKRAELTANIPAFITLSEARFNRLLRTMEMEARAVVTIDSEFVGLPSDFLKLREIHVGNERPLQYMTPQHIQSIEGQLRTGIPEAYTLQDGQIMFCPAPSSTHDIEITYIQSIPSLSDTNPTNWLLTKHPDLYLYATLCQAEAWLMNDARIPMWKSMCDESLMEINAADRKKQHGGGPLIPRVGNVV